MYWLNELAAVAPERADVVMDPRGELVSIADWYSGGEPAWR